MSKVYTISGNSMFAGSDEVSDQFFGSESPSSYNTQELRDGALADWISNGWLTYEDRVVWEDPLCVVNQLGEDVPVTYEQGGILSGKWSNPACEDDPHYCKTTTMHCVDCGATWDREEYTGGDIIRGAKCNC